MDTILDNPFAVLHRRLYRIEVLLEQVFSQDTKIAPQRQLDLILLGISIAGAHGKNRIKKTFFNRKKLIEWLSEDEKKNTLKKNRRNIKTNS